MAEIYVGTSGYDYPEWRGLFYANELPREEFLAFYAEHFRALELNYTYYGMPDERQIAGMVRRSNGRLKFSVKAHKSLTHEISVSAWRDSAKEFRAALYPMANRGLLLSILFQFPQSFHYAVDERRYLDSLMREFEGLPRVVEFRHDSWQAKGAFERVSAGLAERGIGWCLTDMPALRHLPAFRSTASFQAPAAAIPTAAAKGTATGSIARSPDAAYFSRQTGEIPAASFAAAGTTAAALDAFSADASAGTPDASRAALSAAEKTARYEADRAVRPAPGTTTNRRDSLTTVPANAAGTTAAGTPLSASITGTVPARAADIAAAAPASASASAAGSAGCQSAYIRFHGRNAASWHGTNARDRYDYLYSDSELESFLPAITSIAASAQVVQIYFNNHAKGQAVVNARKMKIMCEGLNGG